MKLTSQQVADIRANIELAAVIERGMADIKSATVRARQQARIDECMANVEAIKAEAAETTPVATPSAPAPAVTYEWPARARNFGTVAPEIQPHPYDAYAGYLDADDTDPSADRVLPHAWPPLNKKLSGGLGEQSIDFKAADRRAPRDPVAVRRFWTAHRIAREEIGLDEQAAKAFGDYCVRMGIDPQSAKAAA